MVNPVRQQTFDHERVHWNTAWMKTHGHHFEVVVEPDPALEFRRTKGESPDLKECLRSEHVFADAKKGQLAAEENLQEAFQTTDALEIARTLLLKGELQLSAEHRAEIREAKRNKLISTLQQYAVDPKTGNPHPRQRIELALEEAKYKIDYARDVEEQLHEAVRALQPILPIKLETITLQVHLPGTYGQKLYGDLQHWGTIKKTEWLNDGGLLAYVDMPAGMQNDFIDDLNTKTHGGADVKRVDEHKIL